MDPRVDLRYLRHDTLSTLKTEKEENCHLKSKSINLGIDKKMKTPESTTEIQR